jgi:hypothetical protein
MFAASRLLPAADQDAGGEHPRRHGGGESGASFSHAFEQLCEALFG